MRVYRSQPSLFWTMWYLKLPHFASVKGANLKSFFNQNAEWRSEKKPYHWGERIAESNQCPNPPNVFTIFPSGSDGEETACNSGGLGLIPRSGRASGKGNGYLLQYSRLENSINRGAWWANTSIKKNKTLWVSFLLKQKSFF